MQHVRSPAKYEKSPPEGEPDFVVLYKVRCPGTRLVGGMDVPCGALWYRKEDTPSKVVHQMLCRTCDCLILYLIDSDTVVDDCLQVVVLSIQRSPRERG